MGKFVRSLRRSGGSAQDTANDVRSNQKDSQFLRARSERARQCPVFWVCFWHISGLYTVATNVDPSSARPAVQPECPSLFYWNANVNALLSFAAFAVCQSWRVAWGQRARSDSDADRCNAERHTLRTVHFWWSIRAGSFRMARERTGYICNRLHVFSTSVLLVFHTAGSECTTFTRQRAHGMKGGTTESFRRL